MCAQVILWLGQWATEETVYPFFLRLGCEALLVHRSVRTMAVLAWMGVHMVACLDGVPAVRVGSGGVPGVGGLQGAGRQHL